MRTRRRALGLSFLVVAATVGIVPRAGADEGPVQIGFVSDFSDVSRAYAANMLVAAQMAVEQFNAEGGIAGRKIELVVRDGGNDPGRHSELVKELARSGQVVAIFGGASSPPVLAASAACLAAEVPYLVSMGNSQSIAVEDGHPFVFQFQPTAPMETRAFAIFVSLMPWRRYAWIGPDYGWGHEVLEAFKQQSEAIGASVQWAAEVWHPLGATDYASEVQRLRGAAPDAIVVGSYGEDARCFVMQAASGRLFEGRAVFGWFTYDVNSELGRLLPTGMWSLARGGPFNYLAEKHPIAARFTAGFLARSGRYPDGYSICCFDSFLAWREAVRRAGTPDARAVSQALRGLRFSSLRGERTIRAVDGQMDCPIYFGRLAYGSTYSFAVWESVVEIPASKIWLSEEAVLRARGLRTP